MADTTIAIYGIRLEIDEVEIEALEDRSHTAIVNARKAGLQYYWGNFASPDERYYLFIGKILGILGVENSYEVKFGLQQLQSIESEVSTKLVEAGLREKPSFLLQFQPDG